MLVRTMTDTTAPPAAGTGAAEASTAPARAGLVLGALILVAAVANLNLAVANVALPDIGKAFDSSQTALGGGLSALGPLVAGGMLQHVWWGSVFLVTLPLAALALVLAIMLVPSHVNETSDPVDNLGGILSAVMVGALIVAINFAPVPNK